MIVAPSLLSSGTEDLPRMLTQPVASFVSTDDIALSEVFVDPAVAGEDRVAAAARPGAPAGRRPLRVG